MAPKNNLKNKLDGDYLDLSMMRLTEIPVDDCAALPKATKLDLSNNELTSVPSSFSKLLPHVIRVELGSNKITELPSNFGNLPHLKHLDLYNNQLTDLPLSLANLKSLKYLDVKGNPLKPELAKVVGTCLNSKECQEAAKNLLIYLNKLNLEKEKQNNIKAKREKEMELAKLKKAEKKEEVELARKRADKKAAKDKRRQEMQKTKEVIETNEKQNGIIDTNKPQPKKNENKKNKKANKPKAKKSKGWFTFFNVVLLLVSSLAVATCLMLYSEGNLSINGIKTVAWPKLQHNSMKLYNKTRESLTKENVRATSINTWNMIKPTLQKLKDFAIFVFFAAKDAAIVLILALKEAGINFYETLKTCDLELYAAGLKNLWNLCIKFSIGCLEVMQDWLRHIDWNAIIEGVRWSCYYALDCLISAKESIQNNDTLVSYWKDTENFRSSCWNYTVVAKDAVVKVSSDIYVNYFPIVKEKAAFAFNSVQEYVSKLVS